MSDLDLSATVQRLLALYENVTERLTELREDVKNHIIQANQEFRKLNDPRDGVVQRKEYNDKNKEASDEHARLWDALEKKADTKTQDDAHKELWSAINRNSANTTKTMWAAACGVIAILVEVVLQLLHLSSSVH